LVGRPFGCFETSKPRMTARRSMRTRKKRRMAPQARTFHCGSARRVNLDKFRERRRTKCAPLPIDGLSLVPSSLGPAPVPAPNALLEPNHRLRRATTSVQKQARVAPQSPNAIVSDAKVAHLGTLRGDAVPRQLVCPRHARPAKLHIEPNTRTVRNALTMMATSIARRVGQEPPPKLTNLRQRHELRATARHRGEPDTTFFRVKVSDQAERELSQNMIGSGGTVTPGMLSCRSQSIEVRGVFSRLRQEPLSEGGNLGQLRGRLWTDDPIGE
jgi:hypothetical protein